MADETGQVLNVPDDSTVATKAYVNALVVPERQRWTYANVSEMADPGDTFVRFNIRRNSLITQIALSMMTFDQTDITQPLRRYQAGDELYIQIPSNSLQWGRYVLTEDPVLEAGAPPTWSLLNVSHRASGESFMTVDGALLVLQFQQVGNVLGPPAVAVPLPTSSVIEPE